MGKYRVGKWGPYLSGCIVQSKPDRVAELRELLGDDASESDVRDRAGESVGGRSIVRTHQRVKFNLRSGFLRQMLSRAGIDDKSDLPAMVTRLSAAARHSMLAAMLAAEGHDRGHGRVRFAQKPGPVLDAMQMLCALEGIATGRAGVRQEGCVVIETRRYRRVRGESLRISEAGNQPVWCPETEHGTWVMRLDGQVMLTGNSKNSTDQKSVTDLQKRLAQLGHPVTVDGLFGDQTELALKAFQKKYGLAESGVLDPSTVETLRSPPPTSATEVEAEMDEEAEGKGKGSTRSRSSRSRSRSRDGDSERDSRSSDDEDDDEEDDDDDAVKLDTPEAVKEFQREHGLREDGIVDPLTKAAATAVQRDRESRRDGDDRGSRRRDRRDSDRGSSDRSDSRGDGGSDDGDTSEDSTLRRGAGMSGEADKGVQSFQELLDELGYDLGDGGVDGRFGPVTESAIRRFQKENGLTVDGIVGQDTLARLNKLRSRRRARARKGETVLAGDQPMKGGSRGKVVREASYTNPSVANSPSSMTRHHHGGFVPPLLASGILDDPPEPVVDVLSLLRERLTETVRERQEAARAGDSLTFSRLRAREREIRGRLDGEMREARTRGGGAADFTPNLHPRDRLGRWRDKPLGELR
ncbi:MAG: peptidoglycan-binding protein, partial [Actinobacteria bacterium]|nr:peptidoglycan-binding protein [Actinomycetota bacterium]